MSSAVDDYITRLEQQLRQLGIVDPRTLAEAREHLADAIEDGRRRGLSIGDAEREAEERFGAPEIVAARILEEGDGMKTGFAAVFATLCQGKWWILAPTVLAAVVTGVGSSYFQPLRYRSQTTVLVVPQQVPESYVRPTVTTKIQDRLRSINQQVRSRTRLERIVQEFDLYPERRRNKDTMQDIVDDMNDAIEVDIVQDDTFRVAFTSDSPRTAQQVAERIASFFVDDSLRDRRVHAEGATEFIEAQLAHMKRTIVEHEAKLKGLRAQSYGESLSQADLIEYETLKEQYKALLIKRLDSRMSAELERRQIGEQFKILDPARLPESPIGPDRLRVTVLGTLVGLAIGVVLAALRRSPTARPPALAEA